MWCKLQLTITIWINILAHESMHNKQHPTMKITSTELYKITKMSQTCFPPPKVVVARVTLSGKIAMS
uniref:Uncharacterized protein n=1 Tax=Rhizophora mucronata TaxID=61149 RepID=A0A2P2QAF5_RHIMU